MSDLHAHCLAFKMRLQFFAQVDGSMLPSRAADGNGYIAAVIRIEFRQPFFQKSADISQHFLHLFLSIQVFDHFLLQSGQAS